MTVGEVISSWAHLVTKSREPVSAEMKGKKVWQAESRMTLFKLVSLPWWRQPRPRWSRPSSWPRTGRTTCRRTRPPCLEPGPAWNCGRIQLSLKMQNVEFSIYKMQNAFRRIIRLNCSHAKLNVENQTSNSTLLLACKTKHRKHYIEIEKLTHFEKKFRVLTIAYKKLCITLSDPTTHFNKLSLLT